jgi:hypothetical protein
VYLVKRSGQSCHWGDDEKAKVDDDVSGDVLKVLGDDGLRTVTQLIDSIYETGNWSKDFTQITMIALKKKPKTT